jgi:probable phosphoglycerate mutase
VPANDKPLLPGDDLNVVSPLYFVRHGETDWNRQHRFQGQTDIPLNRRGKIQARKNASLLFGVIGNDLEAKKQLSFISSPLVRALETTKIILENSDLQNTGFNTSDTLKEISFGLWEGLTPAEAKQQYYHERQKRRQDRWSIAPPGGESFASRVTGIGQLLVSVPAHSVIVSHSGILRIILHVLGKQPANEAVKADIPHIGLGVWDGLSLSRIIK